MRPLSMILSAAISSAAVPSAEQRDPPAPSPNATRSVSPETKRRPSASIPRRSHRTWAYMVSWLWPCEVVPHSTVAVPEGSNRISACSRPGGAARSMQFAMPRPRSRPRACASARRASKPSRAAVANASSMFFSNSPESYVKVSAVL